jgi:CRISPR-associated protein Cmr1
MRKLPKKDDKVIAPSETATPDLSKNNTILRQERKYELITPLFGGGVRAGENDNITPISGKTIRGHLRFWWRATRGGQFGGDEKGLKKMKEREAEIWGAASTPNKPSPSQVQIEVCDISKVGVAETPYEAGGRVSNGWKILAYAAFPFQDNPQSVSKFKFTLKISHPESIKSADGDKTPLRDEIEAALWAWETFGGIGARTRRGFGALRTSEALPASPEKIEEWMKKRLEEFVVKGEFPPNVPHLSLDMPFVLATVKKGVQVGKDKVLKSVAYESFNEAWEVLISELKRFRQARIGFGRSKWNEPEQVRRLTKRRWSKHSENPDLLSIERFPRGEFGLPIIFHFKDEDHGEPPDTTLKGGLIASEKNKFRERLASPLILRPLACGGNKAVGLAAILQTPRQPPEGLVLKGVDVEEKVEMKLTRKDALKIEPLKAFASKLAGDNDEVDVLEAFLDRFRAEEKNR